MSEPTEATAGEDLHKGEVVTVLSEGSDKYAYRMLPTRAGSTADGVVESDTKKGERVKIATVKAWGYWPPGGKVVKP